MDDAGARQQMIGDFDQIAAKLGQTRATETAARAILDELTQTAGRT
jgi:hypothetical protein